MERQVSKVKKVLYKIQDGMLLASVYDTIMKKTKYRDKRLAPIYNTMISQKHRIHYYKKFKKIFLKKCTQNMDYLNKEKVIHNDKVYVLWYDGIENAPDLVKICAKSLKENIKNKEIIFLDDSNIFDYITLPDFIMEKYKKGIIGPAHLSDLIRLELLINYGGYWIDSTVLCTDSKMLDIIDKQGLFMYSFYYFGFNPEIMELNNWFIHSETNNNILCLMRDFIIEYWKRYDRPVNYFFFQIFLTIATEYFDEEYKKMPIVSQVDSHVLATYIFDQFDEDKYNLLKQSTGFHKLSTRFDENGKKLKGTFYDVIVNEGRY